jgi:hypothetical protein
MSDQPLRIRRSTAAQPEDLLILDSVDAIDGNGSTLSFINTSDLESGLSLALGRIGARRVDGTTVQLDLSIAPDPSFSSNTDTIPLLSLISGGANLRRVETPADSTLAAGGALSVSGATTLSGALGVAGSTTLSGALSVSGATTLNTTLDVAGDTTLHGALHVESSAAVNVDLAVAGRVGIGTPTPSAKLNVDPQGAGGITIGNPSTTSGGFTSLIMDINANKGGLARIQAIQSSGSAWGTLAINPDGGAVGMGLRTPRTPLHVLGRIATGLDFTSAGSITFFPPDGIAWFHIDNGPAGGRPIGRLRISHGGNPGDNELMSILQNSNIGIGTPAPVMRLHLSHGWLRVGGTSNDFLQLEAGDRTDRATFRFDSDYLSFWTPQVGDFLLMRRNGSVEFRGRLIAPSKSGFVVDQFVNNLGEPLEQGDVLIIGETQGSLSYTESGHIPVPEVDLARQAYDSRVCGIVSEAYADPNQSTASAPASNAQPPAQRTLSLSDTQLLELGTTTVGPGQIGFMVTLGAFAYCKVDADIAPIAAGDLLTTSPTPGHAQKVLDRNLATGAIVGKALESLAKGQGKIPIIVLMH